MKLFYALALVVTVAMVLSPYYFLGGENEIKFDKIIVDYDENDKPIYKGMVDGCQYREPVTVYHGNGGFLKKKDPATCGDSASGAILWNVYEGLYGYHYLKFQGARSNAKAKDGKAPVALAQEPVLKPALADGPMDVSEDGLTYTIKLKKGVYFDRNACFGKSKLNPNVYATREVEAKDFVLAFLRIADGHQINNQLPWAFLRGKIKGLDNYNRQTRSKFSKRDFSRYDLDNKYVKEVGVKAISKYKLQITLNKRYAPFKYVLALPNYAPIPREAVDFWLSTTSKDDSNPNSLDRKPTPADEFSVEFKKWYMCVGTGAYKFYKYEEKKVIALIRNPSYSKRKVRYPQKRDISKQFFPENTAKLLIANKTFGGIDKKTGKNLTEEYLKQFPRGVPPYFDYTKDCDYAKEALAHNEKNPNAKIWPYLPFIDAYVFEQVEEMNTTWMRFLNKRTEAGPIPKETFGDVITPGEGLTDKWRKRKIYLRKDKKPTVYWITFNNENKYFKNSPSLRRAMCKAYDVNMYLKLFANGRGNPVFNCMPSTFGVSAEAGVAESTYGKRKYKNYFYKDYSSKAGIEDSLEEAKALMLKARKELIAAKVIDASEKWPKCLPTFKFSTSNSGSAARVVAFHQQQFGKIGIKITGDFNDPSILGSVIMSGKFDMTAGGWGADYFEAENFLQLYYGPNRKAGYNQSKFQNKQFDKLYEKARDMPAGPEKKALAVEMTRIIANECPILMLFEPEVMNLSYEWYLNVVGHPFSFNSFQYRRIDYKLRKENGGRE